MMVVNQYYLRYGILFSIIGKCLISPVRIIHLEVFFLIFFKIKNRYIKLYCFIKIVFHGNDTIVDFSLLEKSPINGPVLNPEEVSLDIAVGLLRKAFTSNSLTIPLVISTVAVS
jgi:hypothetical protein